MAKRLSLLIIISVATMILSACALSNELTDQMSTVSLLTSAPGVDAKPAIASSPPSSAFAVVGSVSILVFRESLEAFLILTALLASMVNTYRHYRRPMLIGVALACIASVLTWFVIHQTLLSFTHYNKQVDALVSLIVVATLMLTTNWFFHKTYWKNWVARFHKHKQRFMKGGTFQFLGLALLGFASIYREGFEIALFLQPYALETNQYIVLQGAIWGFLGIAVVGFISIYIQVRLPYKKVLIVSGFFVGVVLVMLVGDMVYTMQSIGWLPSTPIEGVKTPIWLIIWLDIYPTWQGVLAQISIATFVVGSYYLAEYLQRHKRLQQVQGETSGQFNIHKQSTGV